MPFNQPSFINQMTAPQAGQSQRKSVPILNVIELEIPALSFESIGSNTVHSKETATIIAAKDLDITTVYGELRPNTKLDFERLPSLSLYAPTYEHSFGKPPNSQDMRLFFGKYISAGHHQLSMMGTLGVYFGEELVGVLSVNNGYVSGKIDATAKSETVVFSLILHYGQHYGHSVQAFLWVSGWASTDFLENMGSIGEPIEIELGDMVS